MRRSICSLIVLVLAVAFSGLEAQANNFVLPEQADVLVVTHQCLRTSQWVPGLPNAWETELLNQKTGQGFAVAIYDVEDGQTQNDIRAFIDEQAPQISHLYLIGDAKRPLTADLCGQSWWDPRPETRHDPPYTAADAANGNFVPAYMFAENVRLSWWAHGGWDWTVDDKLYAENHPSCLVGRLPAETRDEIRHYLAKVDVHLGITGQQPWMRKVLFAGDDVDCGYNGVPGSWTIGWEQRWAYLRLSPTWTWEAIHTSDYQGPDQEDDRFALFEQKFNEGQEIVTLYGPRGAAFCLVNWYFAGSPYEDYTFSNYGMYPLVLAGSCDFGGYDQWQYPFPPDCNQPQQEYVCILERLLFLPDYGIIATLAPTGSVTSSSAGQWVAECLTAIVSENLRNYVAIAKRAEERCAPYWHRSTFVYRRFQLLGDPTLRMASPVILAPPVGLTIYRAGANVVLRWTDDVSPFYRIYSSDNPEGPFTTLEGSTSENVFNITNWIGTNKRFYTVVGWDGNP
jgi:hypothetical protein